MFHAFCAFFFCFWALGGLRRFWKTTKAERRAGIEKKWKKERYDIILRSGLLWNQGVYSGQRFPVMGTGEEGKKWRGKVKKDSYKEIPASGFDAARSGSQKS